MKFADINTGKVRKDVEIPKLQKIMCDKCIMLGLPVKREVPIIDEGWLNKPKRALQIL